MSELKIKCLGSSYLKKDFVIVFNGKMGCRDASFFLFRSVDFFSVCILRFFQRIGVPFPDMFFQRKVRGR